MTKDISKMEKALDNAKKSWKKIIEWWQKVIQWSHNITGWASKSLRHTIKWGYYLIDAGDKAIWEKIEKKQNEKWKHPWKVGKFVRDNTMKLAIALSALGFWWYEAIDSLSDNQWTKNKTEIAIKISEEEQSLSDFLNSPDVLENLKSSKKVT